MAPRPLTPTAQAGTIESMDCLVTITQTDAVREIEISGGSSARFEQAMRACVATVLDALGHDESTPIRVLVQDNGAQDVVLAARVEAAYRRYLAVGGGCEK